MGIIYQKEEIHRGVREQRTGRKLSTHSSVNGDADHVSDNTKTYNACDLRSVFDKQYKSKIPILLR